MLCNRHTDDPLLKKLLEWDICPLQPARRQSPVGNIYLLERVGFGKKPSQSIWRPDRAFVPPLGEIGRSVIDTPKGQVLTDIGSSNLDLNTTANVVARMMPSLDDKGKARIRAALAAGNAASCSVRLVEPRVERANLDDLQVELRKRSFSAEFADAFARGKAYLCTGGWSAMALEISVTDKERRSVKLGAELEAALQAAGDIGISLISGAQARRIFKSTEQLFFGAEAMKIEKHADGGLMLTGYRPAASLAGQEDDASAHAETVSMLEMWGDGDCLLDVD